MARVRYAKSPEQVRQSQESDPEFLSSKVQSIRAVYETDPAIVAAVLPQPLKPTDRPEVCATFSQVSIQVTPEFSFEIGSAIFGVKASHDGVEGIHLLTMPMTAEQAVLGGRDTFGEPKKLGQIDFQIDSKKEPPNSPDSAKPGDVVSARVTRMGIPYLSAHGTLGESLGPREFTEYGYCFKAMPSCEKGRDFDADPLLVRLAWKHQQSEVYRLDAGELVLTESPFDPVADLPIRRIMTLEYEKGTTESSGSVLQSIPGDWLLPFLHQRYDDPTAQGVELPS